MMRLKIALLCALVLPFGTAKADVTTFSNNNATAGGTQGTLTSFIIHFKTKDLVGSGFSLGVINLRGTGTANSASITARLYNISGAQIGATVTGAYTSGNNFDLSGIGLFGNNPTDGLSLEITGLDTGKYNVGNAAALTGDNILAANTGRFVTSLAGSNTAGDAESFSVASFTVAVPEPATMILTGSALAAGAIGAYFKRRRKPQTEIAA